MSTTDNPHDSVVRQTLGRPEVAIGYFRHNLPKDLLDQLDLATLERVQDSFVDPELHPSASDLLFTVDYLAKADTKGEQERLLLYLLIEHKSYPDRLTLFQLLRYMVRIWERHCMENRKNTMLPTVYPMILYHGGRPWPYPLNFQSLFSVQDQTVLRHLPEFSPVLHDVARSDDQEITGETAARTLLLVLKYIFRPDLAERLPDLLVQAQTLLTDENGREIMFTLLYYLTEGTGKVDETTLTAALDRAVPGGDTMKSFLKKYFDQGRQEGRQEGEVRLLLRLLRKRFGDLPGWAEERLRRASSAMLENWSERILTASTLDEVFSEQGKTGS
ncbi:MAG: Rpn family recombination-promoting nuclease/putative transposase [Candidatus Electrothrix sp. Rat3]|nr:Rpn family recombination-promoting nuclease/putative transposase [Candidatus Electrothrix rattekaaiensis]